jgi:hypothetical protein
MHGRQPAFTILRAQIAEPMPLGGRFRRRHIPTGSQRASWFVYVRLVRLTNSSQTSPWRLEMPA